MNLSFRHYYWRWLKNLIFLFFLFAILMTMARISFALYFGEWATLLENSSALRKAFWLGFRFDLMPLAYINLLPFLVLNIAYFINGKHVIRVTRFFLITLMCFGYYFLAWLYVADYGFYSYYQEHINIIFFGLFEDDTAAVLLSIWKNYPVILWGSILFFLHFGFYRFVKFLFSPYEFDLKTKKFDFKVPAVLLGGIALLAFMGRGNFTRLPLSIEDAFISDNEFINEIALNGPLTLNRAIKIRKTYGKDKFDYLKSYGFASWQDAYHHLKGKAPSKSSIKESLLAKTPVNPHLKENPPHVVLIVMESFGTYWNDRDSDEFQILGALRNHFNQGILFKNFLSAENGTIGSMVSIATSQVIRPGARFLSESEFMKTSLASSGNIPFQESGYETHFIYGGKLGWRNLGKYLAAQKFDHLWGADEIKEAIPELGNFSPRDLGNEWGIFDEYLYTFIDEQLRTASRPQFFLVLTTSNHPPFEYPSSYKPLPLAITPEMKAKITIDESLAMKRFLSLQYSNQKMGEFINRVRASSIRDRVIISLTGDHSYWIAKGVGLDEEFKRYAVPFFISAPPQYLPSRIDKTKFGSHEDIFPTLYHLSLSDQQYVKLGENLFEESSFAMNNSGLVANEKGAYHHGKFWTWKDRENLILEQSPESPDLLELKRKAQALIGITDTYLKEEKKNKPIDAKSDQQ